MLMMMAALASAAVALGQPALTKGMEGKRMDADELATARYVGVEKGMDAWMMEGRKHVKQVVLTDLNLEPVVVAPIEGSGDSRKAVVFFEGGIGNKQLMLKFAKLTIIEP